MGAPRQPLNPATQSVGFTAKLVTVRSVSADGQTAITVDRQNTQTQVPMLVQRSKGPLPQPGETWLLTQDLGMWAFAAIVATSPGQFADGSSGAAGGNKITIAAQAPADPSDGDVWLDASAGNEISWWDGTSWEPAGLGTDALADGAVTAAKIAGATITAAQIAANAGITAGQVAFSPGVQVYTGTSQPQDPASGSVWFNPAQGNSVSTWNGSNWIALPFGAPAIADASLTSAQLAENAGIQAGQVDFSARDIGGITTSVGFIQPPAPGLGDLWYDGNNSFQLKQWNGTAWTPYQFGTQAIAARSVTAALIAANTITAAQIAAGTITAAQLAAGSVTTAKIAAGAVTALQIAAGTITALQIAAGIIIAGVVNGTTITGAQIIADGTAGEFLVYSGTPATGNLIASVAPVQSTDSFTNTYYPGVYAYVSAARLAGLSGGQLLLQNGNFPWAIEVDSASQFLYVNFPHLSLGYYVNAQGNIVAQQPGTIAPETVHTVTMDSGWSTLTGYHAPSYWELPDGNVQFAGLAQRSGAFTTTIALNSSNPLPADYRPANIKPLCLGSQQGNRCRVELHSDGIIYVLGTTLYPTQYGEIDSVVSLI